MKEESNPLMVTIQCFAYNQENYIRQCLDGFVMQETNFRYEAIVHDDASTDGTAAIICEYASKYPDIIIPIIEKENQYSKRDGSLNRIMQEYTKGKYVAFCEGDDYWINPLKLQNQVDFLESHQDYGMCYTDFNYSLESKGRMEVSVFHNLPDLFRCNYSLQDWLICGGYVGPMTWVVERNLFYSVPKVSSMDGSFVHFAHFLANTKVKCLSINTAVYRCLDESASHSKDMKKLYEYTKNVKNVRLALVEYYSEKLENSDRIKKEILSKYYKNKRNVWLLLANRDNAEALECDKFYFHKRRVFSFVVNSAILCFFFRRTYSSLKKLHWFYYKNKYNRK